MNRKEFSYELLKAYYKEHKPSEHHIKSFNSFVKNILPHIILKEFKEIIPVITPQGVEEVKIEFNKVRLEKPQIQIYAGSFEEIYPLDARLRNLTYYGPLFITTHLKEDGVLVEEKDIFVGYLPIMVKSKYCWLDGLSEEELIKLGEDPDDPGGYFIINGNERVMVSIEELASNKIILEKDDSSRKPWKIRIFSEKDKDRVLTLLERDRDGIITLTFGRLRDIPIIIILKALGIDRDDLLFNIISEGDQNLYTDLYINFLEAQDIKTTEDALEYLGKLLGLQTRKRRINRAQQTLDNLLFPHIGQSENSRIKKLFFLARLVRKLIYFSMGYEKEDDVDHLAYKKIRDVGDLLAILFRQAFANLVYDMKKNYENIVRKDRKPRLISIVRPDLLTSKILSAMATGTWPRERTGVTQMLEKRNFVNILAHLRRVKSPLEEKRENLEARDLHGTHWGRFCASETPDSIFIGLRRYLSIGAEITPAIKFDESSFIKDLQNQNLLIPIEEEIKKLKNEI